MSEVEVVPHVGVKRRLQFLLVEKVPVDGAEERVSHDDVVVPLLGAESLRLVLLQQTFQKVPSGRGYMWAESEWLVEDVVVHFGDVAAVEGRESVHHLVRDHTQTPPVDRSAVVLFLEHLGGEVLRGTTECGGRVTWGNGGEGERGGRERCRTKECHRMPKSMKVRLSTYIAHLNSSLNLVLCPRPLLLQYIP